MKRKYEVTAIMPRLMQRGGVTERRKCNTQKKTKIPESSGKDRTLKEKEGNPKVNQDSEEGITTEIKALVYLRVGCKQPTSSGG